MFLNNSLDLGSFSSDFTAKMRILVVCCGLKSHTNKLAPCNLKKKIVFYLFIFYNNFRII